MRGFEVESGSELVVVHVVEVEVVFGDALEFGVVLAVEGGADGVVVAVV
eukprot:CAMPEP_0116896152 /NCGR_PEP_ID=MMETSP0467-20121206/5470_1 /TAXON_ID=283647 /ORGANISM="Mesodinium pulex, Strain SPMC105" /LENGTH=48 /DNA_ID= /DNA_START= /DNA_END= /DNA_ORIENTATION=